ncbi:MAG: tripartite tricarboxylate transporter substrate binding protein [Caldimonas sp.]
MHHSRRLACKAVVALAAFAAVATVQAQSTYPDRPVKVVVGFAPGGTNDILARLIASKLQERLKQPFVVDNKAGAASIIAAEYSSKAAPDGYTIFVASSGALTINPALYSKLSYDPVKDFTPVALLGSFPLVIVVNGKSPIKDVKGLIDAAKKAPSGSLNHGVGSSTFQLAAEIFAHDTGIKFTHIPYKGTAPTMNALLAGNVQVAVLDISPLVPHIHAGTMRALAVTTATRSPILPDVPTVAEAGVPGYDVPIWTGLVVPKGTPTDVTDRLRDALKDILAEKDVVAGLEKIGMEPGNADAAAFGHRISADLAKWTAVAKAAGIHAD